MGGSELRHEGPSSICGPAADSTRVALSSELIVMPKCHFQRWTVRVKLLALKLKEFGKFIFHKKIVF